MKKLLLSTLILTTFISSYSQEIKGIYVDISGKQRMYSQKIAKNYILSLQGNDFDNFETKVIRDKISFTRQLQNLYDGARNFNRILEKLDMERRDCLTFFKLLETPIKDKNKRIFKVLKLSNSLLKSAHAAVGEFESAMGSKSSKGSIINTAGKQRMLSQRFCLYFASLSQYNVDKPSKTVRKQTTSAKDMLKSIYNEMNTAINTFYASEYTTNEIEAQVVSVAVVFETLKQQKEAIFNGTADLEMIYNITNKLMFENNILTGMYSSED